MINDFITKQFQQKINKIRMGEYMFKKGIIVARFVYFGQIFVTQFGERLIYNELIWDIK